MSETEAERTARINANWRAMEAAGWQTHTSTIDATTCPRCYAVVKGEFWREHEAWHRVMAAQSATGPAT